jgi:hypothetical protein
MEKWQSFDCIPKINLKYLWQTQHAKKDINSMWSILRKVVAVNSWRGKITKDFNLTYT